MSYLGYPRITFAGRFQADPSTINNSDVHFDDDRFVARYQLLGPDPKYGGWNPRGTGSWRVRGCEVKSVLGADGRSTADPVSDAGVVQADDRVSAKLVDLDPDNQMVSTVFGLRLALWLSDGTEAFAGDFEPAPFNDIWARHPVPRLGMRDFGAVYQSVIDVDQWGDVSASPFLQALRETTAEDRLSIKFNVDGYEFDVTKPNFTWGRIVGAIGPYLAGEPHHFAAVRILSAASSFGQAPAACRIDAATATLSLDLGNSLKTAVPGGSLADAGVLRLVALPSAGDPVVLANTGSGQAYYDSLYEKQAGILDAKLSPEQLEAAEMSPLALLDAAGNQVVAEDPAGRYLRADQFVFRMSPGDTVPLRIHATTFGQAAAGVPVTTQIDPQLSGTPLSALTLPATTPTAADGWVDLELAASDPGSPRDYIDGQVYAVAYGWDGDASVAGHEVDALVWDAYEEPAEPTWVADVQPILQQFANLYPIMRDVVDLGDYSDVALRHSRALQLAMGLPVTDPNYMPVTRDLSPAKRTMILRWLSEPSPPVFRIDDVASLRQVLQLAIELEHATIPPYLCALFSIVPGHNQDVAELIKSVVMQEMLHMALVCNLVNAVGGQARISSPAFVPKYPGHLPGGVRPDLTVSLRKCSIDQVRDVFMAIEAPSEPVNIPDDVPAYVDMRGIDVDPSGAVTDDARAAEVADQLALHFTRVEHEPLTIGWFYQQIGKAIVELGDGIYTGGTKNQMTPDIYTDAPGNLYVIQNSKDALLALQEIERQGEGTPGTDPTDGGRGELAHYYRFQEIVEGRHMIETSPGRWAFDGPEIPFDPAGVRPMADDPDTGSLPEGSAVLAAAEVCDQAYGNLLRSLHQTFNGSPQTLGAAVGLMFSLEVQARELMAMPIAPPAPTTAGPSFQPR